jgi:hypothetical protein
MAMAPRFVFAQAHHNYTNFVFFLFLCLLTKRRILMVPTTSFSGSTGVPTPNTYCEPLAHPPPSPLSLWSRALPPLVPTCRNLIQFLPTSERRLLMVPTTSFSGSTGVPTHNTYCEPLAHPPITVVTVVLCSPTAGANLSKFDPIRLFLLQTPELRRSRSLLLPSFPYTPFQLPTPLRKKNGPALSLFF